MVILVLLFTYVGGNTLDQICRRTVIQEKYIVQTTPHGLVRTA